MHALSKPSPLTRALQSVDRRYRLPPLPACPEPSSVTGPTDDKKDASALLAFAMESARMRIEVGDTPPEALKALFIDGLKSLIREALDPDRGDPVFQAMLLQQASPQVREYASLLAQTNGDQRRVRSLVNAIAHPEKLRRSYAKSLADALAGLQRCTSEGSWQAVHQQASELLDDPALDSWPIVLATLRQLTSDPALTRLMRLDNLQTDSLVRQFSTLRNQQGPRSGTPEAAVQGAAARQRGSDAEARTAKTLQVLVDRLNKMASVTTLAGSAAGDRTSIYKLVTSLYVPSPLSSDVKHAKTEWDVVILHKAGEVDSTPVWDVCLLVEVKASVDAAATDFPRLLRGLNALAQADPARVYPFTSRQGTLHLHGRSLSQLSANADTVLYCCDGPSHSTPRPLSAASRMQLLSAQGSLAYAEGLQNDSSNDQAPLEAVWQEVTHAPEWRPVLQQYATMRRACEHVVHIDDLAVALG